MTEPHVLFAHIFAQTRQNVELLVAHEQIWETDGEEILSRLSGNPDGQQDESLSVVSSMQQTQLEHLSMSPTPPKVEARAIWGWSSEDPSDLTFGEGEVIEVITETNADWWMGRNRSGEQGFFPSNYVEKLPALCEACHTRPKYIDGTKMHPYCGKTCAARMKNLNMCDYCHKQPKYNDGRTTHSFCGKTCARRAMAAGDVGEASAALSEPLKNGCLLCGKFVRKGHFCSQVCSSRADRSAPLLLEVHDGYDTFKSVVNQFKASWRHPTPCPNVSRVYKVIGHPTSISNYEAYRASVEARSNFSASGRSPGNENRRWHGTRRECLLGDNGNTTLCSSPSCSLCNIIRTSYSLNCFGIKTGWGRFGAGIYLSSTSSKSNDYSNNVQPSNHKAILLNKVVVGKGYKMTQDNDQLTAPPLGYDSVLAEVAVGGSLNYDELVCYTENAVRPSYLLIYDA